ncbi:RES family NAD+ phosphorylase [Paenarthrobacter sp. PH39-S1]|uniref:RES family NAD+ phosphorylase n=1 Tax=Paenarthrobacter sp. PH39-S1 TaxID=3046204 RepID=UPI0024B8A7A1|nr:RES family NAD+ phosphorylase [Paenarthrobacter sp. PH39-S1]MDJ0357244.1 RES family NAD+ phosphorylase [Paenarthrobacter sp. PH39-S1]
MVTPEPPHPFRPEIEVLSFGTELYRVLSNRRKGNEFNPGHGRGSRFAFFGTPGKVPVLYAAATEDAAVSERLLHDVPFSGGRLLSSDYADKVAVKLALRRELRLASFLGTGLRTLGIEAKNLTDTGAWRYPDTVQWAAAAHRAGLDGAVWMSRRCNSERAYVLFGDRVTADDLEIQPDYVRVFGAGTDLDWLIDFCARFRVDVLPPL